MIAVDTNVLVYAHRSELPQHRRALAWLRHLAEGSAAWAIPVFCLGEFIRVVTHPRVFDPPTSLDRSMHALESLLKSPSLAVLSPGERYPELLLDSVRRADARGNLAFDAQIAALCVEHRVSRLLTLDRDFTRFPGLKLLTLDEPLT